MKISLLIFAFMIPILMIIIGTLYRQNLRKTLNRLLDFFIPLASVFSGIDLKYQLPDTENSNIKACSLIWIISGISIIVFNSIELVLNKSNVLDIIIPICEAECLIVVLVAAITRYIFKPKHV